MSAIAHILDRNETGLVTVQLPNPAPGSPLAWNVPEYTNILPISVRFLLTTSATVANRHVLICGRRGGGLFCCSPAPALQLASLGINYYFSNCVLGLDAQTDNDFQSGCLSQNFVLSHGEELVINVFHLDGTDQISGTLLRYLQKMPR